jgi:hypothetical protein
MTNFTTETCSQIIYICLNIYYFNTKLLLLYFIIIIIFVKFNMYHVDMCHYIG